MTVKEIRDSIQSDRSKQNIDRIAEYLKDKPKLFKDSLKMIEDDPKVAMRYTWMLGHLADKSPELVLPYIPFLFEARKHHHILGYNRSITKMMTHTGIPEEIEGIVLDQVFQWCLDAHTDVAVKVYGLTVVAELCKKYPEIIPELKEVMADQYDKNSYAFKARVNHVLRQLNRIK